MSSKSIRVAEAGAAIANRYAAPARRGQRPTRAMPHDRPASVEVDEFARSIDGMRSFLDGSKAAPWCMGSECFAITSCTVAAATFADAASDMASGDLHRPAQIQNRSKFIRRHRLTVFF